MKKLFAIFTAVITFGVIFIGSSVFFFSKYVNYKNMLRLNLFLSLLIPILIITVPHQYIISYLFLIGGVVFSLYAITMKGILLEISKDNNRAIYTGIAGAGNILPILFPVFGGWLIHLFGFNIFFAIYIAIIVTSFYFILKLDCKK